MLVLFQIPSLPPDQINVLTSGKDSISNDAKVVVLSYDLLARREKELVEKRYGKLHCVTFLLTSVIWTD